MKAFDNTGKKLPFVMASVIALVVYNLKIFEGNPLVVYADSLANGLPTSCAGHTDKNDVVGTKLTAEHCEKVNTATAIKYSSIVLYCTNWDHLTAGRLAALTLFAVNVGGNGACGSRAFSMINSGLVKQGCNAIAYSPSNTPVWSYGTDAKGQKFFIPGLFNRRLKERQMCLDG